MSIFSNLGHWASNTWDHNRNFVGNALKNVAPALVFVPGLGMVAAGAAGAIGRGMQKGANFGEILKQGVTSAATGGAARGLVSGVQGALSAAQGGAGATSTSAAAAHGVPSALTGPLPGYALTPSSAAAASMAPVASVAPAASQGFSLGGAAKGVGGFLKDNAATIGATGSGLLNARETGQQNDIRERQLSFEEQQYADEQARKKRLAELMAPLYQQMLASQQAVAPNPYTH